MTPREVFERAMRPEALAGEVSGDHLADDVVIEWPFAAAGRPRRIEGRAAFLAMAGPARAAMPIRIDECTVEAVHETADPEVIVVEYRLAGVKPATGERGATDLIAVLRVRDGKVVHWREYQDTLAIARAMAQA
ncbi:nuclear transport factor 2 family protein [Actinoplanes subtropicus]|uniref:nuclear transport factor 2 family protein n=1 Tax=Actinoplanes subtropicus TaxID=543632 RepID=UPI0004C3A387|nr:nuclear transport factor 2 family protein [Actinoplanes subtropicus]